MTSRFLPSFLARLSRQTICKGSSLASALPAASRGVHFRTSMAPVPASSAKTLNPPLAVLKRTLSMEAASASAAKAGAEAARAKKARLRPNVSAAAGMGASGLGAPVAAGAAAACGGAGGAAAAAAAAATSGISVRTRQGRRGGSSSAGGGGGGRGGADGDAGGGGGGGGRGGGGGQRSKPRQQHERIGPKGKGPQQQQQGGQHHQHHQQHHQQEEPVVVQPRREVDLEAIKSVITDVRFDSFPLSAHTLRAVKQGFGFELCTKVQSETMHPILQGVDLLAKAKTGSGKTIAFLVPTLDRILSGPPSARFPQGGTAVRALVLVPTRELATQVQGEAQQLLAAQGQAQVGAGRIGAQVVIGGTPMNREARRLASDPSQLLIATPGRLLDHMANTPGMQERLHSLQVLVLDEADRMLDMGFAKDLRAIMAQLPAARQTLLFSATLPREVQAMSANVLRPNFKHVDVVGEEDADTNIQVRQEHLVVPLDQQLSAIYSLLLQHRQEEPDYKV
ncbi:hypothetical protein CLOP_g8730 [Closterium sp. NIES-67]|nr:hypothetical protein CLOP_g8730 [Closterium sp. NIES-67]